MANTKLSRACDAAFLGLPKEVKVWLNEKSVRNKTSNNVTIGKYVMSDYREHIEDSKKSIVSFSGGKDSTALLLMMLERGMKVDYILFVTREWSSRRCMSISSVSMRISERSTGKW